MIGIGQELGIPRCTSHVVHKHHTHQPHVLILNFNTQGGCTCLTHTALQFFFQNILTETYMLMTSQCNDCIQENAIKEILAVTGEKCSWAEKYSPASPKKTSKLSQKVRIARENPTCRRLRMSSRQAYVAPLFEQVARMILSNHTGSKRVLRCHHHHGKLYRRPISITCYCCHYFILVTGSQEHSHQPSHAPNSDRG